MRRHWPPFICLLLTAMLAMPAELPRAMAAQDPGIGWMSDLEAAKTLAKQTNRLVLVHFWTPSCGPCLMLDQTVFNQAGVASAIEQRFVAVKLNANENSATATGFGITRVPTDVVLTPDGHVVGKLISPPTPAGYVAELNQIAAAYTSTPGRGFANAVANAPAQSQINAAYANLPFSSNAPPAFTQAANPMAVPSPARDPFLATGVVNNSFAAPTNPAFPSSGGAVTPIGAPQTAAAPVSVSNPAAAAGSTPASFAAQTVALPASPSQFDNRYAAAPPASPPIAAPQSPVVAPAAMPTAIQSPFAAPQGPPAGPPLVPAQAALPPGQSPALISGSSAAALTLQPQLMQPPVPPQQQPLVAQAGTVTQPTAGAAPADTRQLPPGAPPLGFDGFCPVSMRNNWKWVPGDPRWGIVHRGCTYWFASQAEQQQFWADPDRYSPALSGMDPVLAIDHQQQVPGKREHSIDYDGLFYMFSSEATLAQFTANPERYAVGVRQAMGIPRGRLVR